MPSHALVVRDRHAVLVAATVLIAAGLAGGWLSGCAKHEKEQPQVRIIRPAEAPTAVVEFTRTYLPPGTTVTRIEERQYKYSPEQIYYRVYYTDPNGGSGVVDYNPLKANPQPASYREDRP